MVPITIKPDDKNNIIACAVAICLIFYSGFFVGKDYANSYISTLELQVDQRNSEVISESSSIKELHLEVDKLNEDLASSTSSDQVLPTPKSIMISFPNLQENWCPWGTLGPCFSETQAGGMGNNISYSFKETNNPAVQFSLSSQNNKYYFTFNAHKYLFEIRPLVDAGQSITALINNVDQN